jgi:acetyl-CoA synthetase
MKDSTDFGRQRDLLLALYGDCASARQQFRWPRLEHFNWVVDFFDAMARGNQQLALRLVNEQGVTFEATFEEMRRRGNRAEGFLRRAGLGHGDRILLMLGNVPELWDVMLGAMKLGCPMIPTTTLMGAEDIAKRLERGAVRAVIADRNLSDRFAGLLGARIAIVSDGAPPAGWQSLAASSGESDEFDPPKPTRASDPLLLYFTSGTTALPKLVMHTHASYPVGHLITMYWLGVRPGDVHLNLSSPGWAKHAYSSFLAPWTAGATVVAMQTARFDAAYLLKVLVDCGVTTFCAPPTVWRSLVQLPLRDYRVRLREVLSAGEPLNAEIIEQVRSAWGLTVREGYGQTETTVLIGNLPGQEVVPGAMGRAAPGYDIVLHDPDGRIADEGEVCVDLGNAPVGIMPGYADDPARTAHVMRSNVFHTGDVARVSADGLYTFVGRNDDVFKSSDYRISPFELESVLVEHPAVQEAAVVPSYDPKRLSVPKAFVVLAPGYAPEGATALDILQYVRKHVSPYMRIRRLEFRELPKTISGKIRRVELRGSESQRDAAGRNANEFWEDDFPELNGA